MNAPEPTREQLLDALAAVRDAVAIPLPATVGDGEVYDKILLERVSHARLLLTQIVDGDCRDVTWSAGYLRDRLAEHPAEGYRTWAEAVATRKAAEGDAR